MCPATLAGMRRGLHLMCALVVAVLAAVGCGTSDESSVAKAHHRSAPNYPARLIRGNGCLEPLNKTMSPITSAWNSGADPHLATMMCVGASIDDPKDGVVDFFRTGDQDFFRTKHKELTRPACGAAALSVSGAGPFTLVKAPEGRGVTTSSQLNGFFKFRGANGLVVTLHLRPCLANSQLTVGHRAFRLEAYTDR